MKLSDYHSSGRESYVFKADGPEGLIGVHADLIASALQPKEKIHYILYAPIRRAEKAPFNIQAEPGSHAVAVTEERFLISKDPHEGSSTPSILSIPYHRILCVEIGSALLLGWLMITFEKDGTPARSGLFYTSTGSHHFEAAIRAYRCLNASSGGTSPQETGGWPAVWRRTPSSQVDLVKSLILENEKPFGVLRSTELWTEKKSRKKRCLTAYGIFLITSSGCLHVVEEKPISPGILAYGTNAFCFPTDALRSACIVDNDVEDVWLRFFRLRLQRSSVIMDHDIVLSMDRLSSAERLLKHIPQMIER